MRYEAMSEQTSAYRIPQTEDPLGRALDLAHRAWGDAWQPHRTATAPGRIELLGNHLDYNGGPVLAGAIDREVCVVTGQGSQGNAIEIVFGDVANPSALEPFVLSTETLADWRNPDRHIAPTDYLRGVLAALGARDHAVRGGAQLVVAGNVPMGLGVSSSAALCVALVLALSDGALTEREIILTAQEAEHRAGTPCGTMDQAAAIAGGVIRYDAQSVSYERLTPDLGPNVFAVIDSGVDRSLGASAYPLRVRESAELLVIAQRTFGERVSSLCYLTAEQTVMLAQDPAISPVLKRRLAHLVSETRRVDDGSRAIEARDWATFGTLMSESGRSSAVDYEVSHPQVEELVAILHGVPGVLGARMMGGGGGGSVLALLDAAAVPAMVHDVSRTYYDRHGIRPHRNRIHVCHFGDGASCRDVA